MCTARRGISDRTHQDCAFGSQLSGRQGKVSDEVKMAGRCQQLQFFSPSIIDNYLLMILGKSC